MQTRTFVLAVSSVFAMSAHADWLLSDYATAATDSLTMANTYGIQTFKNKASTATITAGSGTLVFKATYASEATEGHTANVGILHPITPDWAETDLTGITGVSFEYKNSAAITDALAFSFGSGAYTEALAKAGTVYENAISGKAALAAHSSWTPATLDILDFAPPKWWTPTADFPATFAPVLKRVKNVQFAPKTLYKAEGTQNGKLCTSCVGPDMTAITLELRNITLKGISDKPVWPNSTSNGCEPAAPFTVLDDFVDGDKISKFGGYWYTFTDSGSADQPKDMTDLAKGSSTADLTITKGDVGGPGYATLTAKLDKRLGGAWHNYAGWASIGVGLLGKGKDSTLPEMAALTGISFVIKGMSIGSTVKSIDFKASMVGVSDTAIHLAKLAVADISVENGKTACIRPEDLRQASYVAAGHKVAFDPAKMTKMAWEAKITDQKSNLIDTATAQFLISDVKFHGLTASVRNHQSRRAGFTVRAGEGVLNLSGIQGIQSFEVRSLDGKTITSFAPTSQVALSLPRGSYFLVGRNALGMEVRSFTVVR
ncbi:MAG: hypothetical protein IPK50_07530 [Fibrobacterota bacterium]|nr:hypothetical protein [Fibrobacterota bacterium]QQS06743.1 MAG: hypothetical protein IPK50_07530 [Fibrobacterota bacterium]